MPYGKTVPDGPSTSSAECVFSLDRHWRLTHLNAKARERLGMGDEVVGREAMDLFPLSWATYVREIVEDALQKGIPAQFHFYGRELGSWLDMDIRPTEEGVDVVFRDLVDPSADGADRAALSSPALAATAEEVRQRAVRLGQGAPHAGPKPAPRAKRWSAGELALVAEAIYRDRRRRQEMFPIESAEPQWDILLDLFIQAARNNRVSVTSACIAADVPQSTALRALDELAGAGLVKREPDVLDKRRVWIVPTRRALASMRSYLSQTALAAAIQRAALTPA